MDKNEVYDYVKTTLAEATMRDLNSINMDQELEATLGLDSIGMASVLAKFEPLFEAHENPNELVRSLLLCEKVEDLVETIYTSMNQQERV
ncbi:MAG: hypothetical protein KR126chlam1_00799 [Chlamydiae bacterium]|nr:hypothetical protein [Chlamydiota bacterium]